MYFFGTFELSSYWYKNEFNGFLKENSPTGVLFLIVILIEEIKLVVVQS